MTEPSANRWNPGERPGQSLVDLAVITAIVFFAYFLRLDALTLRGEESRRATVAREMIQTGDWIVPRQQGELFLSRPPLGNWLIALSSQIRGQLDTIAIRFPTVLSVLATSWLLYFFGGCFLGRMSGFSAALAFATMGEILQMGRLAECDTVFTFLVSASLLAWYWCQRVADSRWLAWQVGFTFCALAALQKGPQAPVIFGGAIFLYLLVRGEVGQLFRIEFLLGLVTFFGLIALWQIPYYRRCGAEAAITLWFNDSTSRFTNLPVRKLLVHLAGYPLEALGCTAPWSFFALAYGSRVFRARLGAMADPLKLCGFAMLIGFLPCWITPGGMTRYLMPIYPFFALAIGAVFEVLLRDGVIVNVRGWHWLRRGLAAAMIGSALAFWVIPFSKNPILEPWIRGPEERAAILAVAGLCAVLVGYGFKVLGSRGLRAAVSGLALFMAFAYTVPILNAISERSIDTAEAVKQLRAQMPADARLVSFGPAHHLFTFYYGQPIPQLPWPTAETDVSGIDWFCVTRETMEPLPLPFAWRQVALISVDRNWHSEPENAMIIGRRITGEPNPRPKPGAPQQ